MFDKEALLETLKSFSVCPNLFVLGAGASFPFTPTTTQLKERILPVWESIGSYAILDQTKNDAFERIFNNSRCKEGDSLYLPLLRINPNALEWLLSEVLSIDERELLPPNYSVFKLFARPSVLLNYNLDQYTKRLSTIHIVLEPHGKIPTNISETYSTEERHTLIEYSIAPSWTPKIILLTPETEGVLLSREFNYLLRKWSCFKNIIIIGYSFSRYKETFDDYFSLEFICEMVRFYDSNIILIDPFPSFLKETIENQIKKKITTLESKWNLLSRAIIKISSEMNTLNFSRYIHNIFETYECLEKYDV